VLLLPAHPENSDAVIAAAAASANNLFFIVFSPHFLLEFRTLKNTTSRYLFYP
jgi:hypothetical protein